MEQRNKKNRKHMPVAPEATSSPQGAPAQIIARLEQVNQRLRAKLKEQAAAIRELEEQAAQASDRLATQHKENRKYRSVWYDPTRDPLKELGYEGGKVPAAELVHPFATINKETNRAESTILDQIRTLPPFGPMIMAAIEIEGLASLALELAVRPKLNILSLANWLHINLHNLACEVLDTVPHVFNPGREHGPHIRGGNISQRMNHIKPEILDLIDQATTTVGVLLAKEVGK